MIAIIVILLIFLLIYLALTKQDEREILQLHQTDNPPINISYFNNMNFRDLNIRKQLTHGQYIQIYKSAICKFTDAEFERLQNLYQSINLPDKLRFKTLVCKLQPNHLQPNQKYLNQTYTTPELKWPHTMGNCIMIPHEALQTSDEDLRKTIVHELAHIYQRYNPDEMDHLLNSMGFFKVYLNIEQPANPDIRDTYAYKGVPIYTTYGANGEFVDSMDFKCELTQQGHPYEITAECISRVVIGNGYVRPDWKSILNTWLYL